MTDIYENPLITRYADAKMKKIFSSDNKFSTWRKLWVALAESEQQLGIEISDEQIEEMRHNINNIDYDLAKSYESQFRHDVMAHIYAFGDCCKKAKPIIHLGATSCYVGDNTDIIIMKQALQYVRKLLVNTINAVKNFALKYKDTVTLAYTHFQAAQPTTLGKRATLWAQDLVIDLECVDNAIGQLKLLGCKGTTGTSASFLALFEGDMQKVFQLEKLIASKMGFENCVAVSGQTYTRKFDYIVLSALSGIAQSACKFAGDIRLLSHLKEFDEPFESKQIGSSAMAYKRNPMRSERIASLSRFVIADCINPAMTSATQWLERSLDDSAQRRISIPEAFLAIDGILTLYNNVISNGVAYPNVMLKHVKEELPFMATENILMYLVKKGGDRQSLHELIRKYSVEVTKNIKLNGERNNLFELILNDKNFNLTKEELDKIIDIKDFIGLAPQQTQIFIDSVLQPLIDKNIDDLGIEAKVEV